MVKMRNGGGRGGGTESPAFNLDLITDFGNTRTPPENLVRIFFHVCDEIRDGNTALWN